MTFGILGNTSKPVVADVFRRLLLHFESHDLSYILHEKLHHWLADRGISVTGRCLNESEFARACDMIIALGGDGTMLEAARIVGTAATPILGVNLGKLGFLAEVSVNDITTAVDDILRGHVVIEERMVLEAVCGSDGEKYYGLNDIVIDKGESPRVVDIQTFVNDEYLTTYTGDGVIITTPTGSTAYSLASGGPIITPQSKVIAINPISPHTLTARAVVLPEDVIIRAVARSEMKPIHLTADGQRQGFYETPAEFVIRKAPYVVRLIKREKHSYFDLLRTKLSWGHDIRTRSGS